MTTIYNGLEFDTELGLLFLIWQVGNGGITLLLLITGSQILKLLSHVLTPSVVVIIH